MNSTIGRKKRLARTGSRASPQYESTAEPKAADTKITMLAPTVSARRRWPRRHAVTAASPTYTISATSANCAMASSGFVVPWPHARLSPSTGTCSRPVISR